MEIPVRSVQHWIKRYKDVEKVAIASIGVSLARKSKLIDGDVRFLIFQLEKNPRIYSI